MHSDTKISRETVVKIIAKIRENETTETTSKTVVVASTATPDRYGDIVDQATWKLERYNSNPVIQWGHRYDLPPIGKAHVGVHDGELLAEITWDTGEHNELANTVASQFENGFLSAVSVGFMPGHAVKRSSLEQDDPRYAPAGMVYFAPELLEISAVPIPANPESLAQRGLPDTAIIREIKLEIAQTEAIIVKDVPTFADLPLAEDNKEWDWDTRTSNDVLGDDDWDRYKKAHAYFDPEMAESKAGYKLPFALMLEGKLTAVPRGIYGAMAALNGARGGVDIPSSDRSAAHSMLSKYYEKMEKEPPPLSRDIDPAVFMRSTLKEEILALIDCDEEIRESICTLIYPEPEPLEIDDDCLVSLMAMAEDAKD